MLFAGTTDRVGEFGTGDVVQPWEQVNSQAGPLVSGDKIESFEDLTLVPKTGVVIRIRKPGEPARLLLLSCEL